MTDATVFNPVHYSIEENKFLLSHLGEPPTVALRDIRPAPLAAPAKKESVPYNYPGGINPGAVRPVLERIYELEELKRHRKESWIGVDAVKARIRIYLQKQEEWEAGAARGRSPRFPSLYTFDTKNRPHRSGPGSDTGTVKTYIGEDGQRHEFAIDLIHDTDEPLVAEAAVGPEVLGEGLVVNPDLNRIECFCGHVEKFDPNSQSSYNLARGRIAKHLLKATEIPERHREIHANVFGS